MTPEAYFDRKIDTLSDPAARRLPRSPVPPKEKIRQIHISAICGKAMAPLAGLLTQKGYRVTGSDQQYAPPMSDLLSDLGIQETNFSPENILKADLVIIGNALGPENIECVAAREHNVPYISVAEALSLFIMSDQESIVVAGTHGKTTTTGMLVKLFQDGGLSPSFLVGGVVQGEETAYAVGQGKHFIIEGDEYDTAYFDKRPKFLHYQAKHLIITSLELDHTDIYENEADYFQAFEFLVQGMSSEDNVYLCYDNAASSILKNCHANVRTYGFQDGADLLITNYQVNGQNQEFDLLDQGTLIARVVTPLSGRYNCLNLAAAIGIAQQEGIPLDSCLETIRQFRGMKKRQELLGQNDDNTLLIDDYAHHPTAVDATTTGLKKQYGASRRVIAVFEPRSNSSRRKDFEKDYPNSFSHADYVILKAPEFRHNDDNSNFMNPETVISGIQEQGIPAKCFSTNQEILDDLKKIVQPNDVIVTMSNGHFEGIQDDILSMLTMCPA